MAVLDFGSQFAKLIAPASVSCTSIGAVPHDTLRGAGAPRRCAVILSAVRTRCTTCDAPKPDPAIWHGDPVLGICYGAQLMASWKLGGHVQPTPKREYGPATVRRERGRPVHGARPDTAGWMSHGDTITTLPEWFSATAQTDSTPFAGLVDSRAICTASVPSRGRAHAARPRGNPQLRRRRCRDHSLVTPASFIGRPSPISGGG